jgi:hypothetical protein
MKQLFKMRQALNDPALLGTCMSAPSWLAHKVLLIAAMGEALTDAERAPFRKLTQREREPGARVMELVYVVGRRGGKTAAASTLACYLAACCDHSDSLNRGERGTILLVAQNQRTAKIAFGYITATFDNVPMLAAMVQGRTIDTLSLRNSIDIEVRAASAKNLRGPTVVALIADETAFWPSDESASPDVDIVDSVRPAMLTTQGMIVMLSSPYARKGLLYNTWKQHFGPAGDPLILVAQGTSRDFHPTLDQRAIDRAIAANPSTRGEYEATFRADIEEFVRLDIVQQAVDAGIVERAPIEGTTYFAAVDPSGGSVDSMTLCIAHSEPDGMLVVDALRERRPPFSPEAVTIEFVDLIKRYGPTVVWGDRYGGEWPRESFRKRGVAYKLIELTASDLYKALLPELNSGKVALVDNDRLVAQLVGLERQVSRGGRDLITHPKHSHDDLAAATAAALIRAKPKVVHNKSAIDMIVNARGAGTVSTGGVQNPITMPHIDFGT